MIGFETRESTVENASYADDDDDVYRWGPDDILKIASTYWIGLLMGGWMMDEKT